MKTAIIVLALLTFVISKTTFFVYFIDTPSIKIEADDGQPLKVLYIHRQEEVDRIVASYGYYEYSSSWYYCLNFNDQLFNRCDGRQWNQDLATFFGKTIQYKEESVRYYDFTIWTDKDQSVPTEQGFKDNIEKMAIKFIKYDQEDGLDFLE
jgi:hypothetical protein